jgi:E3 ubiquitin-protein ligase RAD18
MRVEAIDSHLNRCLIEYSPPRSMFDSGPSRLQPGPASPQKTSKKPDRLPHLNYSLFKDTTLRKKLQELGISAQGSRPLLERRHTEWVTLWNANCDASRPRKKNDLLHELDAWERTQGARVPSSNSSINPANQILHKDFDGAGWAAKHDVSFQNLIASARMNLAGATKQPAQNGNLVGDDEQSSEGVLASSNVPLPKGITADTTTNDQFPKLSQPSINE